MSSLIDSIIVSSCIGFHGGTPGNEACQKAMLAGSIQSGMKEQADQMESNVNKFVTNTAFEYIGQDNVKYASMLGYIVQVGVNRSVRIPLARDVVTTITIKPDNSTLGLIWRFP